MDCRIAQLKNAYESGKLTPRQLVKTLRQEALTYDDYNLFTHLLTEQELDIYVTRLESTDPNSLPLWGIPFIIKDNIDLKGIPTTAACKEFAYLPEKSATVVQVLIEAGAIPLAKTNMDQFATGLVGTRSPYGVCHNAFNFDMISGGSSSGSAVALSLGLCSFSLGTDTAGSGRVPAAFNNLVGLKPSKGLLSTSGVVPAVRSQDVVSIFALNAQDAYTVFDIVAQPDSTDDFSRQETALTPPAWPTKPVIGIPDAKSLSFNDDLEAETNFTETIQKLKTLGFEIKEINFQPWLETAKLLYDGAWVAERYAAIESFFEANEPFLDPTVGNIIAGARKRSAADAYKGSYALQKSQNDTQAIWERVDCLLTPTTPTVFSIEDVASDPVGLNSILGTYTNFMNLLDYAAVAMPTGFRADKMPTGVTLFAPAGSDRKLLQLTDELHPHFVDNAGANKMPLPVPNPSFFQVMDTIPLAVVGAHLTGFPLNTQLTERGAQLLKTTQTASKYRFFELAGGPILKPGLVKDDSKGSSIEVEVWAMPKQHLGSFLALIPSPLGLGKVELFEGDQVVGFICEPYGLEGATEITDTGGWRNWMQQKNHRQ